MSLHLPATHPSITSAAAAPRALTAPMDAMDVIALGADDPSLPGATGPAALAAVATPNKELHIFYYFGSCITLASSLFVIFSYIKVRAERRRSDAPLWPLWPCRPVAVLARWMLT